MAWDATLHSVIFQQGAAVVTLLLSNGRETLTRVYTLGSPGDDFIARQAAQEVRNLEALEAFAAAAIPGPITLPAFPDASAADVFFAKRLQLQGLQLAVAQGLAVDTDLAALEADVKKLFREAYTNDFRWKI
jgi:hypothetical protein